MGHGASRLTHVASQALDAFVHTITRIGYAMPHNSPRRHGLRLVRDVAYGRLGDRRHLLDVYAPRDHESSGSALAPVVMYVHGGGFRTCSKDTHRVFALALARRDSVVFNVNYGLGPRHRYPEPLEDVTRALAWVRANAEAYGGDPNRIILAGESAGANLVTALVFANCFERPDGIGRRIFDAAHNIRAAIVTYGFLDLTDPFSHDDRIPSWAKAVVREVARTYVGPDVEGFTREYPLSSPLLLLEGDKGPTRPLPPFFVSCGTRDPLLRQSRRLRDAVVRHGGTCELLEHPGEYHAYDAFMWRAAARDKWRAANAFVERALRVEDEPDDVPVGSDGARVSEVRELGAARRRVVA